MIGPERRPHVGVDCKPGSFASVRSCGVRSPDLAPSLDIQARVVLKRPVLIKRQILQ